MTVILVRYGELWLKSRYVRRRFERRLVENIRNACKNIDVPVKTERDWGHIYVYSEDNTKLHAVLDRIFGIVSFSPAIVTSASMKDIVKAACDYATTRISSWQRPLGVEPVERLGFAVRPSRVGEHEFTSRDIGVEVGSAILQAHTGKIAVDLDTPDIEIFVEVRNARCYIYHEKLKGPGGLPLGTQGTLIGILDGKRATLASWLMMRRGCVVLPATKTASEDGLDVLRRWGLSDSAIPYEAGRDIDRLIEEHNAQGLVLDCDIDAIPETEYPVFLPLWGLPKSYLAKLEALVIAEKFPKSAANSAETLK